MAVTAGKLYVITEAAAMLGVHQNTLRRWANAGKVPHIRLPSGQRRWTAEQIEQIKRSMLAGQVEPATAASPEA
jgi:excisionase family DNA binding protein